MQRVSTNHMNDDLQYWTRRTESQLSSAEKGMGTQSRIGELRDDPLAASHAVRYASFQYRLERFEKNAGALQDAYNVSGDYVSQAVDIMQRVRELAVQGSTGTLTQPDMANVGNEVDELLKELVLTANARSSDGTMLFAGQRTSTEPFRVAMGKAPGADGEAITNVDYIGSLGINKTEVSDGEYVESSQPGNAVFWAEKQQVVADRDARGFRLDQDAAIRLDGKDIQLRAGDNAYTLIARINESGTAVKASLDPVSGGLVLQTTDAHQIMLEDGPGSSVMRDLGVLKNGTDRAGANWAPTARVSGGSLFDAVIRLRDALRKGDVIETGGLGLQGVDNALASLERRSAEIGARTERLKVTQDRLNREIPDVQKQYSREADLDVTTAITDLKKLENTHQAALQTAGRLLPQTLLDYLK